MNDAAAEVFTAFADVTGKGAIPCPSLIFNVESASQVTRQAKLGRRCWLEITVMVVSSPMTWGRVDIVIGLDNPTRQNVAAGNIRPLAIAGEGVSRTATRTNTSMDKNLVYFMIISF